MVWLFRTGLQYIIFVKYEVPIFVRDKIFSLLNFIARTILQSIFKPRALPWAIVLWPFRPFPHLFAIVLVS